jgi:pimeloyl-ACP methyl ester carboxylesterase
MDLRELMRALNLPKIALVAHDRGVRVATRFAKDHPEVLERLVVMDNVPTRIVGRELDATKARDIGFSFFTWFRTSPRHSSLVVRTSGCVTSSPTGALTH